MTSVYSLENTARETKQSAWDRASENREKGYTVYLTPPIASKTSPKAQLLDLDCTLGRQQLTVQCLSDFKSSSV